MDYLRRTSFPDYETDYSRDQSDEDDKQIMSMTFEQRKENKNQTKEEYLSLEASHILCDLADKDWEISQEKAYQGRRAQEEPPEDIIALARWFATD